VTAGSTHSTHSTLSGDDVVAGLGAHGYLPDAGLATAVLLAMRMQRPLLLEGEPGTGKTELARALSSWTGGSLIRLQCYEGLDAAQALYEWDYTRQLMHLRTAEAVGALSDASALEVELYGERFLIRRPLLQAISDSGGTPPVLLIDELDRADDEFEAFLLEVLAEFSVTVPELGTFTADVPPIVIITSNRTRDVHDALKRRCLYHWVEHPELEREIAIVRSRVPEAPEALTRQVAALTAALRELGLHKPPGVAETIDWVRAMGVLQLDQVDDAAVSATLGAVLKYREDTERVRAVGISALVADALSR
jgi:MoxR-like ATPase